MNKTILIMGAMPGLAQLLETLGKIGPGEFDVHIAEGIAGRTIDGMVFDEIHDEREKLQKLVCAVATAETTKRHAQRRAECFAPLTRSKGDRHKNKRYRWC